jgi:hypothetical protein
MQLLQQYHKEGQAFMQGTFTSNETQVHHYKPASKHQSMEWKHMIGQDKEIQKCAFCWQSEVSAILGL